jgi:flagellar motor switch protein FliM
MAQEPNPTPPAAGPSAAAGARADITSAEVDALLEKKDTAVPAGTPQPYDLVARDKIVRGRMPVLDRLNERWVSDFQRKLTDLIRQPVEVSLQQVQLAPYGDWLAGQPMPTSLNLCSVKPWPRSALVAVEGKLLFALVEKYYGGGVTLVLPLSSFEPVRDKLAEGLKTVSPESRQRWHKSLRSQLENAQLELTSVFVETEITLRELLQMKPGDVLPIEMPKTATLRAGPRPLLRGKFGRSRGYNAVSVLEAVKSLGPNIEESSR